MVAEAGCGGSLVTRKRFEVRVRALANACLRDGPLGSNSRRRGADGEQVERTDWFRVRTMGSKAEYVQRFTKGQRVLVIGRLEIGEWQTREGETRTSYDIWADDVVHLSPREDVGRGQDQSSSAAPTERPPQPIGAGARRASAEDTTNLEDLPF